MFASLFRADGADDRSVFGDFWFSPIGQNSSAGVRVGPDQAMRLSTVYRCVRVLAATMASLPPCFYRPKGRGREKVTEAFRCTSCSPSGRTAFRTASSGTR
jgi:hypothetical protein